MKRRSRDSSSNLAAIATSGAVPPPEPSPEPPAKRARRRSSLTGGEEPPLLEKAESEDIPVVSAVPTPPPITTTTATSNKKQKQDKKQGSVPPSINPSTVASVDVSPRSTTSNSVAMGANNVNSSASDNASVVDKVDIEPFNIGHCLVVKYRDNSHRLAKIIEHMKKDSEEGGYNYYVHYFDFNRRMDEWIESHRIISTPSVANPMEAQYAHHHHGHGNHPKKEGNATSTDHKEEAHSGSEHHNKDDDNHDKSLLTTIAELEHDEHEGLDEAQLKEHEQITKVKNIQRVQLGKYNMECWYFSPFPKEFFAKGFAECLYFCEYSLRFFSTKDELLRFQKKGIADKSLPLHPPGHEIYRDENLSMFELDGSMERIYCQNLCYFAKLFLDHKTLFWDVDAFLFYVLCTRDARGFHPVGYFSKEKYSDLGYNLACILTFPCVQRRGYGRFLIEFSYELSKKEDKFGSPEKPLSDLGALGYKSYWAATLVRLLRDKIASVGGIDYITIADLACLTSIQPDDIIATLQYLGLLIPQKEYLARQQKNRGNETASTVGEEDHGATSNNNPSSSEDSNNEDAPTMDVDEDESKDIKATAVTVDSTPATTTTAAAVAAPPAVVAPAAPVTKSRQPPQLRRHHQQKQQQQLQQQQQAAQNFSATAPITVVTSSKTATSAATASNNTSSEEKYVLLCDLAMLEELARMYPEGQCHVQPHRLHWTPFYVMDPKKDKWSLYQMRQASASNPQTSHVLSFLQQEQVQQQQQQDQVANFSNPFSRNVSQGNFVFSGLTRNISSTFGGGYLDQSNISMPGFPVLSRQTTMLLNSSCTGANSNNNASYLWSRLSTPNLLTLEKNSGQEEARA